MSWSSLTWRGYMRLQAGRSSASLWGEALTLDMFLTVTRYHKRPTKLFPHALHETQCTCVYLVTDLFNPSTKDAIWYIHINAALNLI